MSYFFCHSLKREQYSYVIDQKYFSEYKMESRVLQQSGLGQTMAQSKGCSEGTEPMTVFEIKVLYSKYPFVGS